MPDKALAQAVAQVVEKIARDEKLNEQNTKSALIDPILAALGWDINDWNEVHREYKGQTADNPVDYALMIGNQPTIMVEAKALNAPLDKSCRKEASQAISYAATAGVRWAVLTNGKVWNIYNAHAALDVEEKLLHQFSLSEDTERALRLLPLLARADGGKQLHQAWQRRYTDLMLDKATEKLLDELTVSGSPAPDLVALIAARTGLAKAEVKAGLLRQAPASDSSASTQTPATGGPIPEAGESVPKRWTRNQGLASPDEATKEEVSLAIRAYGTQLAKVWEGYQLNEGFSDMVAAERSANDRAARNSLVVCKALYGDTDTLPPSLAKNLPGILRRMLDSPSTGAKAKTWLEALLKDLTEQLA